jgi:hypothetical protein
LLQATGNRITVDDAVIRIVGDTASLEHPGGSTQME